MKLKTLVVANIDRAVALGLVFIGAAMLLVAWVGVSSKALAPEQIPYLISGGLGGIFLGAIGCTVWLSADIQDEWRRLDNIENALSELTQASTQVTDDTHVASSNGRPRSQRARAKAST